MKAAGFSIALVSVLGVVPLGSPSAHGGIALPPTFPAAFRRGAFYAWPHDGMAPLAVRFFNAFPQTIGLEEPTWSWDFGDGGTSSLRDPVHIYTTAGTFTVSVTMHHPVLGSSTRSRSDYIHVWLPLVADPSATPASVSHRNAGFNPDSYLASAPVIGGTLLGVVDLSMTGHEHALLFGFDSPVTQLLPGGQTLLCSPLLGGRPLVGLGADPVLRHPFGGSELFGQRARPGPIAVFSIAVPNDPSLCGRSVCTQALQFGGGKPFALSNAQDLVIGF